MTINIILSKSKNIKNKKSIQDTFSKFLFHENRKQKIKTNMKTDNEKKNGN